VRRLALILAERLSLRLILVHTIPARSQRLRRTAPPPGEAVEISGADAADGVLRRIETGDAAERLCAVAHEERARFVVVGSRGHGALRSAFQGSVSSAMVRHAPCPVVIAPPHMSGPPLQGRQIVCAIENSEDLPAATTAEILSRDMRMPLELSHVLNAPALSFNADTAALMSIAHSVDRDLRFSVGDPSDQILKLADSAQAILLVVGSRALGPLEAGLIGSVSQQLVRRATRPVVVCRREPPDRPE
jgi:nucleotide-binding universal stress UspA family protein